ncbi:23S rRNA (cytosine1962-C5)-methyltransferase [Azospirillum lipoferum]|uniref:Class I SAM-dependent rRNA methyltransferase n=1 Tax=Azospirillum lipoferum TaxID=193 RepID=A0A5A9GD34_AZOLI|nr:MULTISPECIES: class I SAM-dependent rRNA methyltransferase [Azospirillum]KAA0592227.1 class I SAM-dependent rRNA methyltransferase [Azospirillum lipoferum]MCP1612290.1 23S rRNA (cytosine1962-C5)-methyltransferase [Azospirillum lipoferum]MDW5536488.1 class I SAM-dependent rRNA methyltransferase [Azospirillum sp. NL1]
MSDTGTKPVKKYPAIHLQSGRQRRVMHGHPWVYSNEVQMDNTAKAVPPGSPVRLLDPGGTPLGIYTFNPHTLIAARLLSGDPATVVDHAFIAGRLRRAVELRDRLFTRPFYRVVHAEADGLPGLIVDRFDDVVTVQANSVFMDRRIDEILAAIDEVMAPRAVILRNDSTQRALEGLAEETRLAKGEIDGPIRLEENGVTFFANPLDGQKTGWFYDQRDNRAFIASLARGGRAIDFFSYNGGFGIQCAVAGATQVIAVDRSALALENATRAAEANGVADRFEARKADAFQELERLNAAGETFQVVVADPPAFVKSKKDLAVGCRAYRKMARLAAKITAPGGYLLCGSCSHNVDPPTFAEQVARGLNDAGRTGRILRSAGAGPDHPVHPHLPESAYLKAIVLQLD